MSDARFAGLVAIGGVFTAACGVLAAWWQRGRRRMRRAARERDRHPFDVAHRGRHPYDGF